MERATALDPLNARSFVRQGQILLYARRYGEAIDAFHHAMTLESKDGETFSWLGDALVLAGKPKQALAAFAQVSSDWDRLRGEAIAADRIGDRALADQRLAELKAIDDGSLNFQFAEIYAQWGQVDNAFESLAAADRADDPGLAALVTDPFMDPLRSDPRFQALVKKRSV
jgi:tetratricopeptide (TPR) repeat protein